MYLFPQTQKGLILLVLGQQRTPMLVQPHSKIILRDAIKSDTEFLSKSNIMDYSYVYYYYYYHFNVSFKCCYL